MAIYHCSAKIIGRSAGRSAVGASAYRAGEKLYNEHDGMTHDYTKKSGVVHSEIMLCENAPAEYQDRQILWNAVEKIEKGSRAQFSREIEVALPEELNLKEQKKLIQDYVKENFVSKGMCADIAIHDKKDGNPHAHIMLTMRSIDEQGKWESKSKKVYHLDKDGNKIYDKKKKQYKCHKENTTKWNEKENIEKWRSSWANKLNGELEKKNILERVDHRSFERQGTEKIPTIHLGSGAHQMEQKGIETDRGNYNRNALKYNGELVQIESKLESVKTEIESIKKETEPEIIFSAGEVAEQLYNQENEVVQLIDELNIVREDMWKLEEEKRSIPTQIKQLKSDRQSIVNLGKQNQAIQKEIDNLKNNATFFSNHKAEIASKENELKNKKNIYNITIQNFKNTWKITPKQEEVQEKISAFQSRLSEIEVEQSKFPSFEVLREKENRAIFEYKVSRLLANLRSNSEEIKKEFSKLEQVKSETKLEFKLQNKIRYLSKQDKIAIAEILKAREPKKAIQILEQLEESQKKKHDRGYER